MMFSWFKRDPRWRILEQANGNHVLQEYIFDYGLGAYLYESRGTFPTQQDVMAEITRRNEAARANRVVRAVYID